MKYIYDEDDGFGIALSDVLIGFVAILLIHFTPIKNDDTSPVRPGSICTDITWPSDRDIDIDLWAKGPDKASIGYKNPHGLYLDLLKDVVGFSGNPSKVNYEIMCGQKLKEGSWTFNVSYYGKHDTGPDEIPVRMNVWIKNPTDGKGQSKVITAETKLNPAEEKTIFNFELDDLGNIVEQSVNHRFVEVRK